ncbi:MAG: hypothetical protein A2808_00905 [Candidatus Moranbacteria bacterium RIFCSPHIGHO2_01_FULL_55_24]|nr:MAG: hypothetical protein A2808_00905 [Candidatus Moranbacteria bacterium RIFCSPHIGHO2_01_FULL_55_24]
MYSYSYRPPKRVADITSKKAEPEKTEPFTYEPLQPPGASFSWQEERRSEAVPASLHIPRERAPREYRVSGSRKRIAFLSLSILLLAFGAFFWYEAKHVKNAIQQEGETGYAKLSGAVESLSAEEYALSLRQFGEAERAFTDAQKRLDLFGGELLEITRFVPGLSRAASGKNMLEAGEHIAKAGPYLAEIVERFHSSKDAYGQGKKISLLQFLKQMKAPLGEARKELEAADAALQHVALDDIPEEKREQFLSAREHLPAILGLLTSFDQNEAVFEELLGGNGPRKYLFLLQNNHELRATGGFIGTYALLDMNDGVVRQFFVDGIFNPDGQLKENIVPPKPLQKVSAGWSLHDSNWFPDFPTSAEKAIFFYEKTGGPTVDGVITLTPEVMQKLLVITGPITLEKYGLTVDSENFIPVIQEQVEERYDREENKPKQVLADLSMKLFERVFALQDEKTLYRMADALIQGLNEKHVLLYARDHEAQALIDASGWSGRMLDTKKDYLSVVHSNINGYKTDGVIDETIRHRSEIAADGSVIDTVTITRVHNGGHTPYEWWNRVNADYLRVYVPEGSELLSAKGMTWEFPEAPLDYDALGFRRDQDVTHIESSEKIHEPSGTRIGVESGKTVFGNWVYVSPQESVTVEYRYRLPYRLSAGEDGRETVSQSVLYQKQAGTEGSRLESAIVYPEKWQAVWQTGGNLIPYEHTLKLEESLKADRFVGAAFRVK